MILYRFRIEDPTAFTKPFRRNPTDGCENGPVYVYTCHEGNFGMTGLLVGAHAQENRAAEEAAKKQSR